MSVGVYFQSGNDVIATCEFIPFTSTMTDDLLAHQRKFNKNAFIWSDSRTMQDVGITAHPREERNFYQFKTKCIHFVLIINVYILINILKCEFHLERTETECKMK